MMDFSNSKSYSKFIIIAIDTSLFNEATLKSEPKWGSFNASNRGDLGLEGSRGNVGNLKTKQSLVLEI